jgi:hypothetical protein
MTNETPTEPTPDEVSLGPATATAPSRARRTGRALTWVAVGAVGATVLTGVAFAASSESSSPSASPSTPSGEMPPAPGERGGPGHGRGGPGGVIGGLRGDVLHGEFVVKDGDATKTMLSQSGEVTAVSSTELTVKSTDGFTATWTLSSSTTKVHGFALKQDGKDAAISAIKVGATVAVAGTKTTSTSGAATQVAIRPTAAQLAELQKNAPSREWGKHRGGRPGDDDTAPAPSATASSSSTGA